MRSKIDIRLRDNKCEIKSDILDDIRRTFSVSEYNGQRMCVTHMISPIGRFPVGLLPLIQEEYSDCFFDYDKAIDEILHPKITKSKNVVPKTLGKFSDYREHQPACIEDCFKNGRGVIDIGTAGGKSLIIGAICKTILETTNKTILIVTPANLVLKTMREFVDDFGLDDVSCWCSGYKPDYTKRILIVSSTSLKAKHLPDVDRDVLIVDECHICKKINSISKILTKLSTNIRFGFTGTVPKKDLDKWTVHGIFGGLIHKVNSQELKEKGYKAFSKVNMVQFVGHHKRFYDFQKEKEYVLNCEPRNKMFLKLVKTIDKNILIPIDRDFYGEILEKNILQMDGKRLYHINASVPSERREQWYREIEHHNNCVIVAKVGCLTAGVSINNIHYILFPYIGKEYIRVIQLVGRGERLHEDKDELVVIDCYDDLTYSARHAEERMNHYNEDKIPIQHRIINL